MPYVSPETRERYADQAARGVKECRKCKNEHRLEDMPPNARQPDGRDYYCHKCKYLMNTAHDPVIGRARAREWVKQNKDYARNRQREYVKRNWFEVALRNVERKARVRGIAFDLWQHADALKARAMTGRCEMTGIPFREVDQPSRATWDSFSIDRIKPELGYTYNNVRLVIFMMNAAMNEWGEDLLHSVMTRWLEKRL